VGGHIEVQNATPVIGQHQKHIKDLAMDSGHREEVDGDQLLGVIIGFCSWKQNALCHESDYVAVHLYC
jgi:hypothetical protein